MHAALSHALFIEAEQSCLLDLAKDIPVSRMPVTPYNNNIRKADHQRPVGVLLRSIAPIMSVQYKLTKTLIVPKIL